MNLPGWARVCLVLACLKVIGGVAGFVIGQPDWETVYPAPVPQVVFLIQLSVYGMTAGCLILGSRRDLRAVYLGAVFLVVASSLSTPLLRALPSFPSLYRPSRLNPLDGLQPDAFMPYFFWLFVRDFPKAASFGLANRIPHFAIRLCILAGAVLFLANLVLMLDFFFMESSATLSILGPFERKPFGSYYWPIVFTLFLPALPFAIWKTRTARPEERRRVRLFVASIVVGYGPMMIEVVLEALVRPFAALMSTPSARLWVGSLIIYPPLLSVPVMTAYSVLVNHVLDVRLVIRRALQYALARYSLIAATSVPFAALVIYVYQQRNQTVTQVFSGFRPVGLIAASVAGLVTFSSRHMVFDSLDRRFFREQFDSRRILAKLVQSSRMVASPEELADLLTIEIDRALHLDSVVVLIADASTGQFVSPGHKIRPLSASSALAVLVEGSAEPLAVDLEDAKSPLRRLPLEECHWLADVAVRLLTPLIASDGLLLAIIALGSKKSDLPFSKEDQNLVTAIASSGALTLENRLLRISSRRLASSQPSATVSVSNTDVYFEQEAAGECQICHTLQPPRTPSCTACGGELAPAPVPYILMGKFRFEQRVGAGGMGVVYRAFDLGLGRTVAIKTLPKISPDYSTRLRREARAMAAVTHPNLALIFGAETWRGTPMLVFEYLEGGTLADRLKNACLSPQEAVNLGIVLADVLERVHAAGILHRDVKPRNIGYTAAGVPKLLDFGLAHILHDSRRESEMSDRVGADVSDLSTIALKAWNLRSIAISHGIVGTPLYLSPEAMSGDPPDVSFDLWSVSIVLYEAIAGKNPVERKDLQETMRCILEAMVPDIRTMIPACPESLALFFREALGKTAGRRPASARELRNRLESLTLTVN